MTPLIDGDILLHEIGYCGNITNEVTGEPETLAFDTVADILNDRIDNQIIGNIQEVGDIDEPIIFITDMPYLAEREGRVFTPNFRYDVAKTKPYKAGRKSERPFHFYNILAYLIATRHVEIVTEGYEADDMMGVVMASDPHNYIICSRDKDLRQIPGWHYSWECGKQPSIGPHYTNPVGRLVNEKVGYGFVFLMYQMLIGDSVDNIPGLKGYGPKKAFPLLQGQTDPNNIYNIVMAEYAKAYPNYYDRMKYFNEQGDLLYIKQKGGETFMQFARRICRNEVDE